MSSTNKTANYQLSQFVGNDIPSILNDYNGDMRKIDTAIKEVANAGGDNATAVAELQATVGQHTTEIGGLNSTVNSLSGRVIGIEGKIPANASESNKLITAQDIPDIPSVEQLEQDVSALQGSVATITNNVANIDSLIPATASGDNMLVTEDQIPSPTDISQLKADVSNIQSVIPSNASASNHLATMNDIPSGSMSVLLHLTPSASQLTNAQIAEQIASAMQSYNVYVGQQKHLIDAMLVINSTHFGLSRVRKIYLRLSAQGSVGTSYKFAGEVYQEIADNKMEKVSFVYITSPDISDTNRIGLQGVKETYELNQSTSTPTFEDWNTSVSDATDIYVVGLGRIDNVNNI